MRQLIIHKIDQVFLFLGLPFFRVMTALASRGATGRNAIPPQRSVLDAVNVGDDLWIPNTIHEALDTFEINTIRDGGKTIL